MRTSKKISRQSLGIDLHGYSRIRNKSRVVFAARMAKIPYILISAASILLVLQELYKRNADLVAIAAAAGSLSDNSDDEAPPFSRTAGLNRSQENIGHHYHAFNNSNPHDHSWCPHALCRNSPICMPCSRRYLFIVANGRSGSTTLLRMLNLLPGVRLSGENNGVLISAASLERDLGGVEDLLGQRFDVTEGAWMHNGIPTGALACSMQQIINTINPPPYKVQHRVNETGSPSLREYDQSTILGMKTVRLGDSQLWDAKAAAKFFQRNFPCSKIIVNIRSEIRTQALSSKRASWKEGNQTEIEKRLRHSQKFLKDFHSALGPEMSTLMDMKEWKDDISIFNAMVKWLGFEGCVFKALYRENHNRYQPDRTTEPGLDPVKCKAL